MFARRWKEQNYLLDKMGLRELNRAYATYPGVWAYAILLVASLIAGLALGPSLMGGALSVVAVVLLYPLFWYGLHRFVLHSQFLYRFQKTSALWKRIHYDHHRRPNDLSVLFGSLANTLPTIGILCGVTGALIAGWPGFFLAVATGLLMTMLYEYVHCIQHLGYLPDSARLQRMKRLHLLHHFHNENGNYGITEFWPDRLLGSFYGEGAAKPLPRSATVRNLGYTSEVAKRYPWVEQLSGDGTDVPKGRPRPGAPLEA
ncbi:sterol desaturase family protein [Parvularcula dongshanensis]|uniref:Sterol desaturase/sphingolipid hydroxylase (Fatty acid hydroxylase superfamily) n=1 Tax=Parvularcula dongshanensis TaxID=1173995 RepID=A0A840I4T2_9PROT|nr:sterol desaturase family protein [Parvularcula dongshanensis]MBB4659291.1 sterol desaturase/sphingolipid hydroxylase (fatty acid hydroxylase superfamily) [Parvularcula dongshanensis]